MFETTNAITNDAMHAGRWRYAKRDKRDYESEFAHLVAVAASQGLRLNMTLESDYDADASWLGTFERKQEYRFVAGQTWHPGQWQGLANYDLGEGYHFSDGWYDKRDYFKPGNGETYESLRAWATKAGQSRHAAHLFAIDQLKSMAKQLPDLYADHWYFVGVVVELADKDGQRIDFDSVWGCDAGFPGSSDHHYEYACEFGEALLKRHGIMRRQYTAALQRAGCGL